MASQHALVETAKPRKPRHDRTPMPPTRYCLVVRGHVVSPWLCLLACLFLLSLPD